jgi:hypothetical protein
MALWSSLTWGQEKHMGVFFTKIINQKGYDFLQCKT